MPLDHTPKPSLLWASRAHLDITPLELLSSGGAKPPPGFVPVIVMPCALVADGLSVQSSSADFEADGYHVSVSLIVAKLPPKKA